jgi:isocitrate dehydrogenase (NAD+)
MLNSVRTVTLIPGDGTGPELTEATRCGLDVTGVGFEWDTQEAAAGTAEYADAIIEKLAAA